MKIAKQLINKVKSTISGVSTFIPTQLSFWNSGQVVTSQNMNTFSQDLYEKLALLTTNVNNFPAVIFSDGGISKFKVTDDKKFIDVPALACAFYISTAQGNNLPYKPYVIGYTDKQRVLISVGTITQPLYVRANLEISNIDTNPTNVPTPITISVTRNDVNSCLLCVIYPDGSINFNQTNFLVNSAVNTIADNTALLNAQNNFNAITPQALSLFSNLGHVDAFDIRVLQNGGYDKDRVIREYDTTGYWVYYQSQIDNNINPKPTLASHVGWGIIIAYKFNEINNCYTNLYGNNYATDTVMQFSHNGLTCYDKPYYTQYSVLTYDHLLFCKKTNDVVSVVASYSPNGSRAPFYQDINMSQVIGEIIRYGTDSGKSIPKNRVLTLSNGTVISMQQYDITPNIQVTTGYANNTIFKEVPFVMVVPLSTVAPFSWQVMEQTTGHLVLAANTESGTYCDFSIIAIGTLANYVGDELAKIREYKSSFYYDDLPEERRLELRQYYISLDETKDLTKVTAPAWLEAELKGKELA